VNTTETGEPLGEGPVDTLAVIEHGAARGFWRGADEVLAVKQLAERQTRALNAIRALIEDWRYKGEFGWGPWQSGEGPDAEGFYLDQAAGKIRAILDEAGA
jgi:hypothetical protein